MKDDSESAIELPRRARPEVRLRGTLEYMKWGLVDLWVCRLATKLEAPVQFLDCNIKLRCVFSPRLDCGITGNERLG